MRCHVSHIVAFAAGFAVCLCFNSQRGVERVITKCDTVTVRLPAARDTVQAVRYVKVRLPYDVVGKEATDSARADTVVITDSVGLEVVLPAESRHYADTLYDAWVSGVDARLDSIRVYNRTKTIVQPIRDDRRRWGVGVTAGAGWNGRGIGPFIGVGLTWDIVRF